MAEKPIEKPARKEPYVPMVVNRSPIRKDVVGKAGEFIDDFILALDSKLIYNKMGVNSDKTFLITGKPGTGKSLGIEAIINEANKELWNQEEDDRYFELIGMSYDIGKYGTAYINMGSKIAQGFFDYCYGLSTLQDVVIVLDEAEVLFGKRQNVKSHNEDHKLLDTIMKNMQQVHDTPNLYAVLMSNYPDAFDEASIRSGRIDKRYEFLMPNYEERKIAFKHTVNQINERAQYQVVRNYDLDTLSEMSNDFSYADIVESVKSAVKLRASQISKKISGRVVTAGYIRQNRLEDSIIEHAINFKSKKNAIGFK